MKRYVRPVKEIPKDAGDEPPVSLFFGEEPAYFSDKKIIRPKSKKLLKRGVFQS